MSASACSTEKSNPEATSGIIVSALVSDGTDVASVLYSVQRVSCDYGTPDGAPYVETRALEDQVIPGGNEELQDAPLDADSAHLFADLFKVLPAGCYDVTATPVDELGNTSEDCAAATKRGIEVLEGETTEVFMIAQCEGVDPGALDAIVALNHEPVLEDVTFADSKFACGSPSEICIEASDSDFDPIEIVLEADGCDVAALGEPGCFEVTCSEIARVDLVALVYDQLWVSGSLVRIEDWLADEGYPNESHGQLDFFAYVDGIVLYGDEDGDGYGAGEAVILCEGDDTAGYSDVNTDCDDADSGSNPGAMEACGMDGQGDGVDNDCDGEVDEGCEPEPPAPGTDVVVFNDINPFDNIGMSNPSNVTMVENLVSYTTAGARNGSTVVLMDRGRNSVCAGTGECSASSTSIMSSVIAGAGLSVTDITSTSGSLTSFDPSVKVIFLWNPTVAFTVAEINAMKDFAAEGGRVVFIGEWDAYYSAGIPVENAFLLNMGAVMTNIGLAVDCGRNVLPDTSLRPHQITTDMTDVSIACASVIVPGPNDYPLYYDQSNTHVLAGVATIDTTHISTLDAAEPVIISENDDLVSTSASGE